jgi:hypothetical protein
MVTLFTRVVSACAVGAALVLVASPASAHFDLESPASWSVDDQVSGMPEKLGPCGNEGTPVPAKDDAGRPLITAVQEGDMITVTIKEVVPHPGHYRISLSTDWADAGDTVQAGFPPDPLVTAGATNSGTMVCPGGANLDNPCGTVPIEQGPFPVAVPGVGYVLADDVFEHCEPFANEQTIKVALPPGVTCTECVLQVRKPLDFGPERSCRSGRRIRDFERRDLGSGDWRGIGSHHGLSGVRRRGGNWLGRHVGVHGAQWLGRHDGSWGGYGLVDLQRSRRRGRFRIGDIGCVVGREHRAEHEPLQVFGLFYLGARRLVRSGFCVHRLGRRRADTPTQALEIARAPKRLSRSSARSGSSVLLR